MTDESEVDRLLDRWEELRKTHPQLSLDRFAAEWLQGIAPAVAEEFRRRAEALASVDRKMEQVAGRRFPAARPLEEGVD